jgi:hypothetical protein
MWRHIPRHRKCSWLFNAHDAVFVIVRTCTSYTTTKGYSVPKAVTMMLGSYAMQCLCMVSNSTRSSCHMCYVSNTVGQLCLVYVTSHWLASTAGQCGASAHTVLRHSSYNSHIQASPMLILGTGSMHTGGINSYALLNPSCMASIHSSALQRVLLASGIGLVLQPPNIYTIPLLHMYPTPTEAVNSSSSSCWPNQCSVFPW